jgi:hypothetical protein
VIYQPRPWTVVTPEGRRHEIVAVTITEAIELVGARLGRAVRLTPKFIGESGGTTWHVRLAEPDASTAAPTVYSRILLPA